MAAGASVLELRMRWDEDGKVIRSRDKSVVSTGSVRDGGLGEKPSRVGAVRTVATSRCQRWSPGGASEALRRLQDCRGGEGDGSAQAAMVVVVGVAVAGMPQAAK